MPLTLMVRGLDGVPDDVRAATEQLTFRNTTLVYLNVDSPELFPDQWLYVHSPELRTGRITNFRNWVPQLHGAQRSSILAMEYWSFNDDPLWQEDDATLIQRAQREIRATGLVGDARILDGAVVRVPRCYPVYRTGYRAPLERVVDYLKTFSGLTPIGRYGAFKYNNQDHSILMGILAARQLLEHVDEALWNVNTDYETYQEAAVITETGLEPAHSGA
jgi:protoporphyrinogen oxidase